MNRYVDAEGLIDRLYEEEFTIICPLDEVSGVINNEPTADVQPVRHGEWIDVYKSFETAECSLCHSQFEVTFEKESNGALWDGFKRFYNYCPNCGAKMEEKNE